MERGRQEQAWMGQGRCEPSIVYLVGTAGRARRLEIGTARPRSEAGVTAVTALRLRRGNGTYRAKTTSQSAPCSHTYVGTSRLTRLRDGSWTVLPQHILRTEQTNSSQSTASTQPRMLPDPIAVEHARVARRPRPRQGLQSHCPARRGCFIRGSQESHDLMATSGGTRVQDSICRLVLGLHAAHRLAEPLWGIREVGSAMRSTLGDGCSPSSPFRDGAHDILAWSLGGEANLPRMSLSLRPRSVITSRTDAGIPASQD